MMATIMGIHTKLLAGVLCIAACAGATDFKAEDARLRTHSTPKYGDMLEEGILEPGAPGGMGGMGRMRIRPNNLRLRQFLRRTRVACIRGGFCGPGSYTEAARRRTRTKEWRPDPSPR